MASEWSDPWRIGDYLAREIPHRDIAEQLLLEALPEHVQSVVDLGTGDGRVLALVRGSYPDACGIGLDVSEPMLARARERFAGERAVQLVEHDLTQPLVRLDVLVRNRPLDAFVSALAIHHMEHERKRALFAELCELLRPGGVFVNLDLTRSPTPGLHARFREAIGRAEDDPADRLADACEQLAWLRDAGFALADCRFKWLELTLLVAVRE